MYWYRVLDKVVKKVLFNLQGHIHVYLCTQKRILLPRAGAISWNLLQYKDSTICNIPPEPEEKNLNGMSVFQGLTGMDFFFKYEWVRRLQINHLVEKCKKKDFF